MLDLYQAQTFRTRQHNIAKSGEEVASGSGWNSYRRGNRYMKLLSMKPYVQSDQFLQIGDLLARRLSKYFWFELPSRLQASGSSIWSKPPSENHWHICMCSRVLFPWEFFIVVIYSAISGWVAVKFSAYLKSFMAWFLSQFIDESRS